MTVRLFRLFILLLWLVGGVANAATVDFGGAPVGTVDEPLRFAGLTVSETSGGSLFVYHSGDYGMPVAGGICALKPSFDCTGEISVVFVGPVSRLSFSGYFATRSDAASVAAYAGDRLIGSTSVTGDAGGRVQVDLGTLQGVTRLAIADRSSPVTKGIAWGDFRYEPESVDPLVVEVPSVAARQMLLFDAFARGWGGRVLDLGYAILTVDAGGEVFVYNSGDFGMPQGGGFCALTGAFACTGAFSLDFKRPVTELSFDGYFAKPTDSAVVWLFDGDALLFNGNFAGNAGGIILFDFTRFARITRLFLRDTSDFVTKGIAYGNFQFRLVAETTSEPPPGPGSPGPAGPGPAGPGPATPPSGQPTGDTPRPNPPPPDLPPDPPPPNLPSVDPVVPPAPVPLPATGLLLLGALLPLRTFAMRWRGPRRRIVLPPAT